jgi:hypothetical protein
VRDFDESLARLAADALRGRIRRDQRGMLASRSSTAASAVELGVADFGIVEDVIEMLVVANLLAQGLDLFSTDCSSR